MNTSNESKRPSAEPCNLFAPDDIVRHVRSGHICRVLGRCTIEATLADCYMYRCTDGHVWIRPVLEMEDGRFVLLTRELDAAQPAQAGEAVYQVKFRTQDGLDAITHEVVERTARSTPQSPAVSPPSVVAVSEEASGAFDAWWRREMSYLSSADRAFAKTAWCAALESFAQRIAGSGERDAELISTLQKAATDIDTVRSVDGASLAFGSFKKLAGVTASLRAAIAQQNKRGDQK